VALAVFADGETLTGDKIAGATETEDEARR